MNYFHALTLSGCLLASSALAQNLEPVISNLWVYDNSAQNRVEVFFDVADAESDNLDIRLAISDDQGTTFLVDTGSFSGDLGFPVVPGQGKIAYWDYPAGLGSLMNYRIQIIADDRQAVDIGAIANLVDSNRLRNDLAWVQGIRHRTAGNAHLEAVKDSIESLFSEKSYQVSRQDVPLGSYTGENIIGRHRGFIREDKTWIVDGHFDGVSNSPAADDNGSAVVGMMEVARLLGDYRFEQSIRFIGFDLEETGLDGSGEYVSAGIEPYEQIEGVLNLEMIGFYSDAPNTHSLPTGFNVLFPTAYAAVQADSFRGNFVANVANVASDDLRAKFDSCAGAYVSNLRVISLAVAGTGTIAPDLRRSDHARFWDAGIPALMLTDGANFRNPYYHSPNDTLENLDFGFMRKVTQATLATVAELAKPLHAAVVTAPIGDIPFGMPEHLAGKWFDVFPNPSRGRVRINVRRSVTKPMRVEIYSLNGDLVDSQNLGARQVDHVIDLRQLGSGVYTLLVYHGATFQARSVVIE